MISPSNAQCQNKRHGNCGDLTCCLGHFAFVLQLHTIVSMLLVDAKPLSGALLSFVIKWHVM